MGLSVTANTCCDVNVNSAGPGSKLTVSWRRVVVVGIGGCINKATLCPARLVVGCVAVFGQVYHLGV